MKTGLVVLAVLLWSAGVGLKSHAAETAYDFRLDELAGRAHVQMDELDAKPLVVHIWAPDCPMCERNMPYFKSMADSLDKARVNLVACSMGNQRDTATYVDAHKLAFKVLYSGHAQDFISKSFTADGWPTSFVFAPGGELVGTCDAQGIAYQTKMLELVDKAIRIADNRQPAALRRGINWWPSIKASRDKSRVSASAPAVQLSSLRARAAARVAARRAGVRKPHRF